jgi:hypothetical protein
MFPLAAIVAALGKGAAAVATKVGPAAASTAATESVGSVLLKKAGSSLIEQAFKPKEPVQAQLPAFAPNQGQRALSLAGMAGGANVYPAHQQDSLMNDPILRAYWGQ